MTDAIGEVLDCDGNVIHISMTKTEAWCHMEIHSAAAQYYTNADYNNWKLYYWHNDLSWAFYDLLNRYYPDKALRNINRELGWQ